MIKLCSSAAAAALALGAKLTNQFPSEDRTGCHCIATMLLLLSFARVINVENNISVCRWEQERTFHLVSGEQWLGAEQLEKAGAVVALRLSGLIEGLNDVSWDYSMLIWRSLQWNDNVHLALSLPLLLALSPPTRSSRISLFQVHRVRTFSKSISTRSTNETLSPFDTEIIWKEKWKELSERFEYRIGNKKKMWKKDAKWVAKSSVFNFAK